MSLNKEETKEIARETACEVMNDTAWLIKLRTVVNRHEDSLNIPGGLEALNSRVYEIKAKLEALYTHLGIDIKRGPQFIVVEKEKTK